jgi:hypothetical protein
MSHYTKGRPTGYYNDLLVGDDNNFKKLLRRYSICPTNNIGKYYGKHLGDIKVGYGAADADLAASTRSDDIKMRRIESDHKIAYLDLGLSARQQNGASQAGDQTAGDMITFDATYAVTANYVPVYYLPWEDSGASVRLTIPVAGANMGPSHGIAGAAANPYIFFTAAINGCSIFFRGTRRNPTIFHCGGSTGRKEINDQAHFWESVMIEFASKDDTRGKQAKLGALSPLTVDKRDYITTPGVKSTFVGPTGTSSKELTTARAKSYLSDLKSKHAIGRLSIESVSPWACVLGRRDDAGDWTFYLQENATITYHQLSCNPMKMFSGVKATSYAVCRPLVYSEIFPNGPAHVTVRASIPKII